MSSGVSREDALRTLISLAHAEGLPRVGFAFAEDLQSSSGEVDCGIYDYVPVAAGANISADHSSKPCLNIINLKLSLEMGRLDEVFSLLPIYIDSNNVVQDGYIYFLEEVFLVVKSKVDIERLSHILSFIERKMVRKELVLNVNLMSSICDVVLGNGVESSGLKAVFKFDENSYLENNADVNAAVKSGGVSSGYLHYSKFGLYEGRVGYQSLSKIAAAVNRVCDVGVDCAKLAGMASS